MRNIILLTILILTHLSAATYERDDLDRLTKVTYDNGAVLSYEYDAAGNLLEKTSEGVISVPSIPSGITASDGTYDDKIHIEWGYVAGADDYRVYRCTDTSTSHCMLIGTTTDLFYDDYNAKESTSYYYRIKARNASGESGYSSSIMGYRTGSGSNSDDETPSKGGGGAMGYLFPLFTMLMLFWRRDP